MDIEEAFAAQGLTKVDEGMSPPDVGGSSNPSGTPATESTPVASTGTEAPVNTDNNSSTNTQVPAFDESKWLSEKFSGKFKSVEELVNSINETEQFKSKYSETEKRLKDLETEYADAKPVNDYIKGLNKFVKDGGDPKLYNKLQSVEIEKMSDRDALIMKMRWDNGLSKEDAQFMVDRKYMLEQGEDLDTSADPDVRAARIALKLDSKSAKEFLRNYKTEQLTPPAEKLRIQQEQAQLERMNGWKPRMSELLNDMKKIELPYDGQTVQFEVPQETLSQLQEYMQAIVEGSQFQPDVDGMSAVKQLLLREVLASNLKSITQTIATQRDAKWKNEVHHPSALREDHNTGGNKAPDRDTELAEFFAKADGVKLRR